jgi:hypothetical protein
MRFEEIRARIAQHLGDDQPAPDALTLMRPRSSGVMSMVSRVVRRVCDRGPSARDPHDFSGGRGSHKSDTRIDGAAQ